MKVFMSYNRADATVAETVAGDLRSLGYTVWYDREVSGGQTWWDAILHEIRECDLLLFIVTVRSLDSEACMAEYRYASQLGKRVLPVLSQEGVRVNLLPPELSEIQFVDYRKQDKQAAFVLVKALDGLPPARPLPSPLPVAPPVPVSYLGGLRLQIVGEGDLSLAQQSGLLVDIKQRLKDPESRQDALDLLRQLRRRKDLLASVAEEIDATLAAAVAPEPRSPPPPQPSPAIEAKQTAAAPPAPAIGARLLRWALYAFLALVGLGLLASLAERPSAQLWCCDAMGLKRCPMVVPGPIGAPCNCSALPGQGVVCM